MSSLREIKDRIASVRSTLKITTATKLVSAAKLHKAERSLSEFRNYESAFFSIVSSVLHSLDETKSPCSQSQSAPSTQASPNDMQGATDYLLPPTPNNGQKIAIVAIASNSSLCGAFNSGVLRKVEAIISEYPKDAVDVFPLGRKIAEPLRKRGYCIPCALQTTEPTELLELVSHPNYNAASHFASVLSASFDAGTYSSIILVYNHFISRSKHQVVCQNFLPFTLRANSKQPLHYAKHIEYIFEPSAQAILEQLKPQMLRMRIFSMVLNSAASEHAARTIAMQTASDNAQELLNELTLEYNKQRQQQITSEILDIIGGSQH